MIRLAHLTDPHIDGSPGRSERLARALDEASASGAQHLLLTGDLTSHGAHHEVHELSQVLYRWDRTATIVGGNHDGPGFGRHLSGELSRFAHTSTPGLGYVIDDVTIVPVATYFPRRAFLFRALGSVGQWQFAALENAAASTRGPIVVAMHHGPQLDPMRAFAGLVDRHRIDGLLRTHRHVSVCCGHDHRVLDVGQVHVAASCATHPDPLRVYDVGNGRFDSVHRSSCEGSYFGDSVCPLPDRH